MNRRKKHVASTTLTEPLPWVNSIPLSGDATDAVPALRRRVDGDLAVIGSGELVQALMRRNLVTSTCC